MPTRVESPYLNELARFKDLVNAGDLNGLIVRYPLRESSVLDRIRRSLRCASKADYERMVVAQVRANGDLARKLKDRIKPLAELLDAGS